ncbi:MAG TPA: hypothetical protein VHU44_13075 [Acidobacteriaceae bacterium]|jgi:hypothetical protein|nr:hypothetical protein [Acidobacteriaceae bacterium]
MRNLRFLLLPFVATASILLTAPAHAQNFGNPILRKKIVLVRKLPPTGHIEGNSIRVEVSGAAPDVTNAFQSTLESLLISNDSRLRTEKDHPDAVISCRITTYSQPPAQRVTESSLSLAKKGGPIGNEAMMELTGQLTVNFQAQDVRARKSIAGDSVTSKFDQEYPIQNPAAKPSVMGGILGAHVPKLPGKSMAGGHDEDRQPTPEELRTRLIHDAALQIASRLVNTSESLDVLLARGGPLDAPNKLMEQQLWTRALESLETMPPLGQPEDDAYRLYNLGVVNEALGYQAEDVVKARKYLQEAAVDYGKAIDAKPAEKNFLEPQTRIDSALAHYKRLGDLQVASAKAATATSAAAADALTNKDIIAMVQGKLDEANIIDTVQHSAAVNFDLTPKGQIDLSKASVNGHIIAAMKQRARQ